jgi:hypothetical protein
MHCALSWRSAQRWEEQPHLFSCLRLDFRSCCWLRSCTPRRFAPTTVLADALALSAATTSSPTRFRFEYGWVRGLGVARIPFGLSDDRADHPGQTIQGRPRLMPNSKRQLLSDVQHRGHNAPAADSGLDCSALRTAGPSADIGGVTRWVAQRTARRQVVIWTSVPGPSAILA